MTRPPLACTVRGCGRPLERGARGWSCLAGHSYDIARRGYLNLLQPQDRRSSSPGDSREAVSARAASLAAGIGRSLIDEIVGRISSLASRPAPVVLDLGSGSGDALNTIATKASVLGIGIDISTAAAEHAARHFPEQIWVVANADRRLPILDASLDAVVSVHGRRNPVECARVLVEGGQLLVALPGPDDLIELRRFIQGEGRAIDRSDKLLEEHRPFFSLLDRWHTRETRTLDREGLMRVLRATYRGARLREMSRRDRLDAMEITFSSSLFVLAPLTQQRAPVTGAR